MHGNKLAESIRWNQGNLTCYWRAGTTRPIVMLHGLCGGALHYDSAFVDSALEGYPLLAIDLPGFGTSKTSGPFSLRTMVDAVLRVFEHYLDSKPWLVAHSMSASIAVRLLDQVAGITLLEGNLLAQHLEFSDKIIGVTKVDYVGEYQRIQKLATTVIRYQTRLTDHRLINHYASTYGQCSADTVWTMASLCNRDVRDGEPVRILSSWAGHLGCIVGTESNYSETTDAIRSVLPNIQIFSVNKSGHFPMIDNPVATWSIVAKEVEDN